MLAAATRRLEEDGRRTVLFLDEIHRFSKAQQDALLPGVEHGIVTLIGATTENPFFEVNSPLISRATLFRLEPLAPAEVAVLVDRARGRRGAGPGRDRVRHRRRGPRPAGGSGGRRRPPGLQRPGGGGAARLGPGPGGDLGRRSRRSPATAGGALRQGRRPAPRRDLGVHQEPARLGPRCRHLLAARPCWRPGRTPSSSPGAWWSWPRRMSAWPTRRPWGWRWPRPTPCSSSACRRRPTPSTRRRCTWRRPPSRTR